MALAGSWVYPHQDRAGIVYGAGLRRCLIIFAPQTLILDRRTRTSRAPSLREITQRSKNFTSGASVSSTPNGPLVSVRRRAGTPPTVSRGRCPPHHSPPKHHTPPHPQTRGDSPPPIHLRTTTPGGEAGEGEPETDRESRQAAGGRRGEMGKQRGETAAHRWDRQGQSKRTTRLPGVGTKATHNSLWPHSVDAVTFHGQACSHREDALSTLSFPGCRSRRAPAMDVVSGGWIYGARRAPSTALPIGPRARWGQDRLGTH